MGAAYQPAKPSRGGRAYRQLAFLEGIRRWGTTSPIAVAGSGGSSPKTQAYSVVPSSANDRMKRHKMYCLQERRVFARAGAGAERQEREKKGGVRWRRQLYREREVEGAWDEGRQQQIVSTPKVELKKFVLVTTVLQAALGPPPLYRHRLGGLETFFVDDFIVPFSSNVGNEWRSCGT
ncbi:unnamed protein product, partial [Ectocarpus sp. 6 AP-2014]